MLSWALLFFIFSLFAAFFGFGDIAAASAGMAQILFYIFLALFFISLIMGLAKKGDRTIQKNL